jgi:hypothetical protein
MGPQPIKLVLTVCNPRTGHGRMAVRRHSFAPAASAFAATRNNAMSQLATPSVRRSRVIIVVCHRLSISHLLSAGPPAPLSSCSLISSSSHVRQVLPPGPRLNNSASAFERACARHSQNKPNKIAICRRLVSDAAGRDTYHV